MTPFQELSELSANLRSVANSPELSAAEPHLAALEAATEEVGRSFSGSWQGYHSRVYYHDLQPAPPGAHFSQEWGIERTLSGLGSRGNWEEFDPEHIKACVRNLAGNPNLELVSTAAKRAVETFQHAKSEIISILSNELERGADAFLQKLKEDAESTESTTQLKILRAWSPKGQIMTRDTVVIGQGTQVPPHFEIKAEVAAIRHAFTICARAAEICTRAASHLERKARSERRDDRIGTNVFIGHGRSQVWRELKDFVSERLRLPWDEFNRIPVAGVTNIARLSEMLDAAAVALVIMTAEDEMADGETQARMNVIHEVGLFQGRLGFTKAIVLVEEGCKEFTNIQGLGQIRFPRGRIAAVFEEVRLVLEREGLLAN